LGGGDLSPEATQVRGNCFGDEKSVGVIGSLHEDKTELSRDIGTKESCGRADELIQRGEEESLVASKGDGHGGPDVSERHGGGREGT
jgi:hypothetical protein